ncbi:hypothetical protein A4F89_02165 [Polynucleobacter asymbioticus]|uniref:Uncharacterized protein n=2 Tax=Polynucleobacter asymbioticus TaxID=576611 RepID=A0AAC9IQJ6_9BURK|nr:hypothetical protein A4F89_02165 [Polynucleobacter asymbioticus]APC00511.1 hypothetical protein AOC25_02170 [Polynucleobacter asymbioticus]
MILSFKLPRIVENLCIYSVNNIYICEDEFVVRGTKLLDIKADLKSMLLHDCPSINFYRIVAQESAYLRRLFISPGQQIEVDSDLGIFSTEQSETPMAGLIPERGIKLGYAGIIHEVDWYGLEK